MTAIDDQTSFGQVPNGLCLFPKRLQQWAKSYQKMVAIVVCLKSIRANPCFLDTGMFFLKVPGMHPVTNFSGAVRRPFRR